MTSEKKIESNRRNAQLNTGPKTPRAKERVSQNAVTHGLSSTRGVLRGEDGAEYERLRRDVFACWKPKGLMEERMADQIVMHIWRLERIDRAEDAYLNTLVTRAAGHRAFEIEHRGVVIGEKLHMFEKETDALIFKEAKNIEVTLEDIESALGTSVSDAAAIKANHLLDTKRQSNLRGLLRCQEQLEEMQERRRMNEEPDFQEDAAPPSRRKRRKHIAAD